MNKAYTLTMGGQTWALDCPKVIHTADATIEPNVYNDFGTITGTRTITKGEDKPNVVNIYIIRFDAGLNCVVNLNDWSLKWVSNKAPTFVESKTYEITIIDNLAMYVEA